MATTIMSTESEIVAMKEPDIFVSGLHSIENVGGGCLKFVFYTIALVNGRNVKVPLACGVVVPVDAVPDAVGKTLMALGRQVIVSASGALTVAH